MTYNFVKHNGKSVGFKLIESGKPFMEARKRYDFTDYCPLCRELLRADSVTSLVLIISNQASVPNRICHRECFDRNTPEHSFRLIAERFQGWMDAQAEYKDWVKVAR